MYGKIYKREKTELIFRTKMLSVKVKEFEKESSTILCYLGLIKEYTN